jgi:CBS domain-containing protein
MVMEHIVSTSKRVCEALKSIPISSLLAHKRRTSFHPLVSFAETASIADVLHGMASENILACPIYQQHGSDRIYTAIVSVYDIMSFAVFEEIFEPKSAYTEATMVDYLNRISDSEFFNSPISRVVGSSKESRSPWILYSSDSLLDLVNVFCSTKQHRALVIDSEVLLSSLVGPIPASAAVSLIAEIDMIKYLDKILQGQTDIKGEILEPLFDITVRELNQVIQSRNHPIVAMLSHQSALHGFRTMFLDNLQGIPVIDHEGNVVANLSASDMRGLKLQNASMLTKPVYEYLQSFSRKSQGTPVDQVRTITRDDTVQKGLQAIIQGGIHRVWVTGNDSEKLVGVLSISDILNLLIVAK